MCMNNQRSDNQLKKAMEEGNMISVGQNLISKEKKEIKNEMVAIDSKFNKTFIKYNLPIGIDFEKSLKPNNFITSLEILDRTLQIPKISEKNRFKLENLRLSLTTGKIWHYKHELNSFLKEKEKEEGKKKENNKEPDEKKKISEKHFKSLLISIIFLLNQASETNIKWVSQNQILKFIDSQDQKNILREWKTKNYGKLPEDTVFLSLISQTLIHQISLLNLPLDEKFELNNLINLAIAAKFSKIRIIAADKLKLMTSSHVSSHVSSVVSSSNLVDESILNEKSAQNQPDINNKNLHRILDTLTILQNE